MGNVTYDIVEEAEWIGKGQDLADLNRFDDALAAYTRALRINPENVLPWNLSGDALFHLDRYEEAVVAYDRVIRLEPDHVYAWQRKGDALSRLDRFEEAVAAYDQAIRFDPENAHAWGFKGSVLDKLNRYEDAVVALDRALRLDPTDPDLWLFLGYVLNKLKRYKEATDSFDQALRISPDDDFIKEARKNVLDSLPKPVLSLGFDRSRLILDKWERVAVKIGNTGTGKARNIQLSFSTDFETRGITSCDLDAGTVTSRDVAMKPTARGKNLLKITTTCQNEYDIEYTHTHEFWIDVKKGK